MKKFLPLGLLLAGLLMAFNKPITGLIAPVTLKIEISRPPIIMPSIYKVYANADALNGKYSLFKLVLTNTSSAPAKNVEVSYSVSNYIESTIAEKIALIQPGQTVVVNCYPSFPDKIVEKMTDSKETVKIFIKGNNIKNTEESFSIAVKGRNEFMYNYMPVDEIRTNGEYFENMPLLSCLVTPNDPIIKYLTQQIQEKVLKGEQASVANKEEEGVRVMQGIYYATLMSHMVYSGTSGVPEKISDVSSIVQTIRLPREVITGKTGLCIELSLLYASIMSCAGMDPVVYLVPGHAYPGFRMNNKLYAIESTGIGGEGLGSKMSVEEAYQTGMKNLDECIQKINSGDDRYSIIDIRQSIKDGAVAMELKDDNFLRQKIDEIAKSFDAANSGIREDVKTNGVQENGGGGNANGDDNSGGNNTGGGSGNVPSGYNLYQGVVTFAYPASWQILPRNEYTVPQSKHVIGNKSNAAYVSVYNFPGLSNPEQALQSINQWVGKFGFGLQYKNAGQANGYTIFNGQTGNESGPAFNWVAAFKSTGNGVTGLTAGANANTGTTYQKTLLKIINTLQ